MDQNYLKNYTHFEVAVQYSWRTIKTCRWDSLKGDDVRSIETTA